METGNGKSKWKLEKDVAGLLVALIILRVVVGLLLCIQKETSNDALWSTLASFIGLLWLQFCILQVIKN